MSNKARIGILGGALGVLVLALLAFLWAATHPATNDIPVSEPITAVNPAVGIQIDDPADATGMTSALNATDVPYVVINGTTVGVRPADLEKAKAAIADQTLTGGPVGYSVITTNVDQPAPVATPAASETSSPKPSASPANTQQSDNGLTPIPAETGGPAENASQVLLLPRGELDDMNQNWSVISTLANANEPAVFVTFPNADVAKAADNWSQTTAELGQGGAASMFARTTDPLKWAAFYQIPADVKTSLSAYVNGQVTFATGSILGFNVETPWSKAKAEEVAKTLPLPMSVNGSPSHAVLRYYGPAVDKAKFDALGASLKAAGLKDPTAVGFN